MQLMFLKEKKVSLLMYFIMQCFKLKEITYLTAYFSSDMNVTQFCKKKVIIWIVNGLELVLMQKFSS